MKIAQLRRKRKNVGSGACQGAPHEERKRRRWHFQKFVTEGNEKADDVAKAGAMMDEGFKAVARRALYRAIMRSTYIRLGPTRTSRMLMPRLLNQQVGLSWTSDICERSGNVGDVKMTDEDGLLSCSMMIEAMNTIMKERLLTNRVAGQSCSSPCIQTGQRDRLSAFAS